MKWEFIMTKSYNEFLNESNVVDINITFNKENIPSKEIILEDLFKLLDKFDINLNEANGKTGENLIGYGVKGKLKADGEMDDKTIINPDAKMLEDDKKILQNIIGKIIQSVNSLGTLKEFLEQYQKINPKPVDTIISQLKTFQTAIEEETKKI